MKLTVALAVLSVAHAWPVFLLNKRDGGYEAHPVDPPKSEHEPDKCAYDGGVRIRHKKTGHCLSPEVGHDGKVYEGAKVVLVDCKEAPVWLLPEGYDHGHDDSKGEHEDGYGKGDDKDYGKDEYVYGTIRPRDYPDLALDAGEHPANGGHLYVYKVNGTPGQKWSIKGHQIQLADGHECVDVDHESKNVQLWTCDEHNENQEFQFDKADKKCPEPEPEPEPSKHPEPSKCEATTVHKTETKHEPTTVYKHETKYETKYHPTTVYETKYETKYEHKPRETITITAHPEIKTEYVHKTVIDYKEKTITEHKPPVTTTVTKHEPPVTYTDYKHKTETKHEPPVTTTVTKHEPPKTTTVTKHEPPVTTTVTKHEPPKTTTVTKHEPPVTTTVTKHEPPVTTTVTKHEPPVTYTDYKHKTEYVTKTVTEHPSCPTQHPAGDQYSGKGGDGKGQEGH